jgi:(1->4)-alpha-D-glucan 1-alpha-D-glucosylmutase
VATDDAVQAPFSLALAGAVHRYLARTPAQLMLVQLEDLTGQIDQVNLPGTTDQYPNWRRKLAVAIAELFADPDAAALARALNEERGAGALAPPAGGG